ncbi:MAG TPA: FkbM family methyltransferase [Bryobacteraceae bacterium]
MLKAALTRLGRSNAARPLRHLLAPLVSRIAVPVPALLTTSHTCYVDTHSVIGRGLLVTGAMDPKQAAWISSAVEGRDGIFIDAGANVGFFSLLALSKMRAGVAHAFEIDPRTLRCLRMTKERGKLENFIVHGYGLGEQRATAGLQAEKELGWTHVDFTSAAGPRFDILPLDDFAGEFAGQRVIAMKMDVEGMELAVARGARKLLAEHRPLVVSEAIDVNLARYGATIQDLIAFMASLDYAANPLAGTDDPTIVFTPGTSSTR